MLENMLRNRHTGPALLIFNVGLGFDSPVFIHAEEVEDAHRKISRAGADDRKTTRPGKPRDIRPEDAELWTGAPGHDHTDAAGL